MNVLDEKFASDPLKQRTFKCHAHFEGTGPPGAICKDCASFKRKSKSKHRLGDPGYCLKWAELSRVRKFTKDHEITSSDNACKYWREANGRPRAT